MKALDKWFVPWLFRAREYNVDILDKAWSNPDHARLMLNENPVPPSDKVINAVVEAVKHGNRYPDSFLRLRTKIGEMYDLGPDNVAHCNGSSETIDAMMRIFLQPGDENVPEGACNVGIGGKRGEGNVQVIPLAFSLAGFFRITGGRIIEQGMGRTVEDGRI